MKTSTKQFSENWTEWPETDRMAMFLTLRGMPPRPRPKAALAPFRPWVGKRLGKYLTCAPSQFHHDLAGSLSTLHERRGAREAWLAPRGSAKTTWSTFAYPLYVSVHGLEPYTVIIADTATQARKYLKDIRRELEDWGLRGPVWRDDSIELANGVAIEALGTGDKLRGRKHRGRRPTLIIGDDLQNKDHIVSPLRRERAWDWLTKDVLSAGEPGTNFLILGTALHREDVLGRLTTGWVRRSYRSVGQWPDRMELWAAWEKIFQNYAEPDYEKRARAFYEQHRAEMDAGAVVLWPERKSLYELMVKRVTDGASAFASEEQNEPIRPESCEWPAAYFDGDELWFSEWPQGLVVKALALDPSKGRDSRSGDYSAFVYGGVDRNGVLFVDANVERRPIPRIVDDGITIHQEFGPAGFLVEVNQFQEMLAYDFVRACRERGLLIPLYAVTNLENKATRIRATLSPLLAQRRIRFRRSPGARLLVDQLRDFPSGAHDDAPDALEQFVQMVKKLLGQRGGERVQAVRA